MVIEAISEEEASDARRIADGMVTVPLIAHLGIGVVDVLPGKRVALDMPASPSVMGPYGAALGAALLTLADLAAGLCAAVTWRADGVPSTGFATEDLSVHFLQAARVGPFTAVAEPIRVSARRAVIDIRVFDALEAPVAAGQASLRCLGT